VFNKKDLLDERRSGRSYFDKDEKLTLERTVYI
jgi:hypothetical protein